MEKKNQSQMHRQKFLTLLKTGIILSAALLLWTTVQAQSGWLGFRRKIKPVIAVDPGHGGHDTGSRGAAGTLEKNVTLALARILSSELGDRYQVILTRADDYAMDISNRAAEANRNGADLLISLHAAGSFRFQVSGTAFCYYQAPPINNSEERTESKGPSPGKEGQVPWEKLQRTHCKTGKLLAEILQKEFKDQTPETPPARVLGLPLATLAGADMPAVLVEIGYLTNPPEELKLCDDQYLTVLAQKIGNGIDRFFLQKP